MPKIAKKAQYMLILAKNIIYWAFLAIFGMLEGNFPALFGQKKALNRLNDLKIVFKVFYIKKWS